MDLLLHEDLGGGFSPPAAHKVRRLGRKSREHGVDRTPYKGDRKISFVSYHTRAISMNIVRATAWTRCTTPRKKLRASSAANAPAAPPRSADLLQLSVAPESECRARAGTQYSSRCTRLEPVVVVPITQYKAIFCGLESKVSTADLAIK